MPRYLGLEGRNSPRVNFFLVHVNGSPRDISGASDNFLDCAHALHGYIAPLSETS